jgi:hypothetical protein
MELDDNVSGILVMSEPFTKDRKLSRPKRPFVVSAIKRFIQYYWIGWLFRFPASKAILKIDQSGAPSSRGYRPMIDLSLSLCQSGLSICNFLRG